MHSRGSRNALLSPVSPPLLLQLRPRSSRRRRPRRSSTYPHPHPRPCPRRVPQVLFDLVQTRRPSQALQPRELRRLQRGELRRGGLFFRGGRLVALGHLVREPSRLVSVE